MFIFRWLWQAIKLLILLVVLGVVMTGAWYAAAKIHGDDPLDPKMAAFYQNNSLNYLNDNAWIGAIGLSAPITIQDPYAWARKLVDEEEKQCVGSCNNTAIDKAINIAPDRLAFQGNMRGFDCWLQKQHDIWELPNSNSETCATQEDIYALVKTNLVMLTRFNNLTHYPHFISPAGDFGIPAGQNLIQLEQAFIAFLIFSKEQDPAIAINRWIVNATFIQRALSDENSLLDRSVLLVMEGLSQQALPILLHGDSSLARTYQEQLLKTLAPLGPKQMNIPAAARAEHRVGSAVFDTWDHTSRNRLFHFYEDLIAYTESPAKNAKEAEQRYLDKYKIGDGSYLNLLIAGIKADWHSPQSGLAATLMIDSTMRATELFNAMHLRDARNRMLNIYVQMKAQGITADQVSAFLSATSPSFYNPFTEHPFEYDTTKKMIYFVDPKGNTDGLRIE